MNSIKTTQQQLNIQAQVKQQQQKTFQCALTGRRKWLTGFIMKRNRGRHWSKIMWKVKFW